MFSFSTLSGPLLDILVGLVFLYAALSLIVSGLGDCLANVLNWRGSMFQSGIDSILRPTGARPPSPPVRAARFVRSIFRAGGPLSRLAGWFRKQLGRTAAPATTADEAVDPREATRVQTAISSAAHGLVHRFLNHPACRSYVRNRSPLTFFGTGKLAYLPPSLFPRVLLQCLLPEGARGGPAMTPVDFRRCLDLLPDPDLAALLRAVTEGRNGSLEEIEGALQDHFQSVMKEVDGWYARKMSLVNFLIGFIVAFLFNLDTVQFIREGWKDPARSRQLADQAAETSGQLETLNEQLEASRAAGTADPDKVRETLQETLRTLEKLKPQLPVGWSLPAPESVPKVDPTAAGDLEAVKAILARLWKPIRQDLTDWTTQPLRVALRWLGLFLTAFAISMQSRFWYDFLQRLLKLRRDPEAQASRT